MRQGKHSRFSLEISRKSSLFADHINKSRRAEIVLYEFITIYYSYYYSIISLVLIIMVQTPMEVVFSFIFGGGGQQIGGACTSDFLDRSTWVLAAIAGTILLSNSMISRPGTIEDSSLLSDEFTEEIIIEELEELPEVFPEDIPSE